MPFKLTMIHILRALLQEIAIVLRNLEELSIFFQTRQGH